MAQQANQPLPNGHLLEEYTIDRQLSLGGFSIVYLATDTAGRQVAIKEYLPNSLALRTSGDVFPVISAENLGAFRYGMKCFFEEGRALARLSHPNVIRVLNFFRANETVYMVMEYEHGRTLQEFIQKHQGHISERFIRGVFTRMLNGLREVHSNKLLHLDLKPSNIYLRGDNTPVLIDFGAARQTLISDQPILKPMYTPGFASPEHYKALVARDRAKIVAAFPPPLSTASRSSVSRALAGRRSPSNPRSRSEMSRGSRLSLRRDSTTVSHLSRCQRIS